MQNIFHKLIVTSFAFLLTPVIFPNAKAQGTVSNVVLSDRAAEAATWGIPIVSMEAMRHAYHRDAKAKDNDVVFWSKPSDWKNQTTTPNSSSLYVYFNFNTKEEPVVIELPAAKGAGLFGTLLNAWQVPLADVGPKGEDHGNGGKYVILPPNYNREIPKGYIVVKSETFNGYSLLRAIPESNSPGDRKKALSLVKKIRIYPLTKSANPPDQKYIDMAGNVFDGIVHYDESFYSVLASMINEEPVLAQDADMMNKLKALGIEKGKDFQMNPAQTADFRAGVVKAHQQFKDEVVNTLQPWGHGSRWGMNSAGISGAKSQFKLNNNFSTKDRGTIYFMAYAPPQKLGDATLYLADTKDSDGQALKGENNYHLHVFANVPAKQFWAVNVYDLETAGFIRESPRVGLDSYNQSLAKNSDGSIDIYFGPKAPAGKKNNWIYTAPGRGWFTFFRFYGPEKAIQDKSWTLPDIQRITPVNQAARD